MTKYNATIVDQLDTELVVCRASIKHSRERLESKLPSLKDGKFYGLTFFEDGHLVYYAALKPLNAEEVTALGFLLC